MTLKVRDEKKPSPRFTVVVNWKYSSIWNGKPTDKFRNLSKQEASEISGIYRAHKYAESVTIEEN